MYYSRYSVKKNGSEKNLYMLLARIKKEDTAMRGLVNYLEAHDKEDELLEVVCNIFMQCLHSFVATDNEEFSEPIEESAADECVACNMHLSNGDIVVVEMLPPGIPFPVLSNLVQNIYDRDLWVAPEIDSNEFVLKFLRSEEDLDKVLKLDGSELTKSIEKKTKQPSFFEEKEKSTPYFTYHLEKLAALYSLHTRDGAVVESSSGDLLLLSRSPFVRDFLRKSPHKGCKNAEEFVAKNPGFHIVVEDISKIFCEDCER